MPLAKDVPAEIRRFFREYENARGQIHPGALQRENSNTLVVRRSAAQRVPHAVPVVGAQICDSAERKTFNGTERFRPLRNKNPRFISLPVCVVQPRGLLSPMLLEAG